LAVVVSVKITIPTVKTPNIKEKKIDIHKIIQESMLENVIKSLLTGKHLNTCLAKETLETYSIIDIVLEKYYYNMNDDF